MLFARVTKLKGPIYETGAVIWNKLQTVTTTTTTTTTPPVGIVKACQNMTV
jgi:hypothetical protein